MEQVDPTPAAEEDRDLLVLVFLLVLVVFLVLFLKIVGVFFIEVVLVEVLGEFPTFSTSASSASSPRRRRATAAAAASKSSSSTTVAAPPSDWAISDAGR